MNADLGNGAISGGGRRSLLAGAGLVLAAWGALLLWGGSPYAPWLDHAEMEHIGASAGLRLGVFALGWSLMAAAMMLPGTLLLIGRGWGDRPLRDLLPLIGGYLAVWTVFGVLCYWGDGLLHEVVEHEPALAGSIAPGVLLLAGVYQFTPAKRACLLRCRSGGAALGAHLLARGPGGMAALGVRHGLFCLGSCWALMLLMFAAGGVDLAWMLLLTLAMTIERAAGHSTGREGRWALALGCLLIGLGTVQMATFLWGQFAVG